MCMKAHVTGQPTPAETSAMRMSEALCIASGLLSDRTTLLGLAERGDGKSLLLGRYGYRADLCAHGMARGADDLAYFLFDNWGRPDVIDRPDPEAEELPRPVRHNTGVIAFVDIVGEEKVRGHIDVWNKTSAIGKAYWNCRKALFWKLD